MRERPKTLTNELLLSFDYAAMLGDFDFYEAALPPKKKDSRPNYGKFYREIKRSVPLVARCVLPGERGRVLFALKKKDSVPGGVSFDYRKVGASELKRVPPGKMLNLLLSIMIRKRSCFEIDEAPYGIYYLHSVQGAKAVALEVRISESGGHVYFHLKATTFTRQKAAHQKVRRAYYVVEGGVMLPYDPERHSGREVYFKGTLNGKRSHVDFMDIGSAAFRKTKVYFMGVVCRDMRETLSRYMDFRFREEPFSVYADGKDKEKRKKETEERIRQALSELGAVPVIDLSDTPGFARNLQRALQERFGEDVAFPLLQSGDDVPESSVCAISVTETEEFYEDGEDPYPLLKKHSTLPVQNITTATEPNGSVATVLLKELLIKLELSGGPLFLPDNEAPEGVSYVAIIDDGEETFYRARSVKGRMEVSPLAEGERRLCLDIICDYVLPGEEPEYIVVSGDSTLLVSRCQLAPFPYFEALTEKYRQGTEVVCLEKGEIMAIVEAILSDIETSRGIPSGKLAGTVRKGLHLEHKDICLERGEALSAVEKALDGIRADCGIPSDKLADIAGRGLKTKMKKLGYGGMGYSARDAESKTLYAGMLGVTYIGEGDGDILYRSGLSSGNIQSKIPNNGPYRRIKAVRGKIDLDLILPLLDEYFVRNGELTVMPYPIKYAREGYLLLSPTSEDSKEKDF